MTIYKNKYQAYKAKNSLKSALQYKVLKYNDGYIVACGLLTL